MSKQNRELDKENRKLLRQQQQSPLGGSAKVKNWKSVGLYVILFAYDLEEMVNVTVKQEKESEDDEQPDREEA